MINEVCIKGFSCRHFVARPASTRENVLFLPGNLQTIESMRVFTDALSNKYNFAMAELPGYGAAEPLPPKFSIEFLADCAQEYVEKTFPGQRIHLIACSYSSVVAIEYAKKYSGNLKSMNLMGAMPEIPQSDRPTFINLMQYALTDKARFAKEFIEFLTNGDVDIPRHQTMIRAAIRKAKKNSDDDAWRFINNTMRVMSYHPGDVSTIEVPTLCATGEHDTYVTPEYCKQLAGMINGATYAEIPGCDHLFHLESPDVCIELMSGFIDHLDQQIAA